MQKTPDEIKKGLDCHIKGLCEKGVCPYYAVAHGCSTDAISDALAYIQQLESKLNQAVEDIRMLGRHDQFICPVCSHYDHGKGLVGECVKCLTGDGFRWRGEKEDGGTTE